MSGTALGAGRVSSAGGQGRIRTGEEGRIRTKEELLHEVTRSHSRVGACHDECNRHRPDGAHAVRPEHHAECSACSVGTKAGRSGCKLEPCGSTANGPNAERWWFCV